MPLDRLSFSPLQGPHQRAGVPHMLTLCEHVFTVQNDGQIAHFTDGQLRAVVPPEGWDGYGQSWPELAELAAELRRLVPAPAANPGAGDAIAPPDNPNP